MKETKNTLIEESLHNTVMVGTAMEQNLAALMIILETVLVFISCNAWIERPVRLQEQMCTARQAPVRVFIAAAVP